MLIAHSWKIEKTQKVGDKRWKEKFRYCIKEKRNVAVAQHAMLSAQKKPSQW